MKKLLLLASCLTLALSSMAQYTTTRFGTASNQDATYRSQKLTTVVITDTAGSTVDTLMITPNSLQHFVRMTVVDSAAIAINYASAHVGDRVCIIFYNTSGSGHFVKFTGRGGVASRWGCSATGTVATLNSAKNAVFNFVFDGTKFAEESRSIQ